MATLEKIGMFLRTINNEVFDGNKADAEISIIIHEKKPHLFIQNIDGHGKHILMTLSEDDINSFGIITIIRNFLNEELKKAANQAPKVAEKPEDVVPCEETKVDEQEKYQKNFKAELKGEFEWPRELKL